jgi:pyruvate dehydrogenase E1 component alpha subunit
MKNAQDHAAGMLSTMLRIRLFEETVAELAEKKEFRTPIHLYIGQEAIAAAVCEHLGRDDYAFSTHRNHGHYIAKGGSLKRLLAEIYCRDAGCSLGHGGSMHVIDPEVGFMGSSAIVAGTIPAAVGAGLSAKMDGRGRISVAFFGDGATDEGVFYESLNMAALYELPVLFICENNLFSTHLPLFKRQKSGDLHEKMRGFGIVTERVDGNNPLGLYSAVERLTVAARAKGEPAFLECMTYRWRAHVGPEHDIDIGFRKKEDIDHWKSRCPIQFLKRYMYDRFGWTDDTYGQVESSIRSEVQEALRFARESGYPDACSLTKGLY